MSALIKKDLLCIRSFLFKQYAFLIIFFTGFSIYTKSTSMLVGMLGMVSFIAVSTGFSFDEGSGFNRYARTLPVTTKQIVGAKYILIVSGLLLGAFICMTIGSAISMYFKIPFIEHIASCVVVFLIFLFTASLNTPFIIKYGVEKSRMVMTLCYLVPFFIGTFGVSLLQQSGIPQPSESTFIAIGIGAVVIILASFIASYFISVRIMENKEL